MENIIRVLFKCDKNGLAEKVLLDNAGIFGRTEFPISMLQLVAPENLTQFGQFWANVLKNSMEENFLVSFIWEGSVFKLSLSGYLLKNKVLICGSTEFSSIGDAMKELMLINSEQQTKIRLVEKSNRMLKSNYTKEINEEFLNDFSKLNNELINKQRELERKNGEILKLNKDLEKARDDMQMYVYAVSHDLKEPVRMVKSFMSLFNKKFGGNLDGKALSYINFAIDGANRMELMINDLLEYYNVTASIKDESSTVDLNEILSKTLNLLQLQIDETKAEITYDSLPEVMGSETGWKQIFQNLISNAIKYVPTDRHPKILIDATLKDKMWELSIKDNGIGMEKENYEKIFVIFKRLHNKQEYSGTGIGLAIVKKNIENLGGEIWLESVPGEGSTFFFTVPKSA
jgi:signal transduction histidine kinase